MQVLDNLVVNAIRHMGNRADPTIRIRCTNDKGYVITSISDNGVGIPEEFHIRIFDRFFRGPPSTTKAGTGLGLYIAKKIVESHKGRIWVESREGMGATFFFTLPIFSPSDAVDYEI